MMRLVSLRDLDMMVARLDLALERAGLVPDDPVARHELDYCLDTFASQALPKNLGVEVGCLVRQARDLATASGAPSPDGGARGRLRSKLLDIAAAISVGDGDDETRSAADTTPAADPLHALGRLRPAQAAPRRPARRSYRSRQRIHKRRG